MAPNKILFFFSAIVSIHASTAADADAIKGGTCMVKLLPCKPFFKPDSAEPTATCCDPLSEIVLNDPNCLCQVISHPGVSGTLNLTLHDVLELTNRCGAKVDSSVCDEAAMLAAEASPSPNAQAATSAEMTDSLLASLANSTNSTGNGTVDAAAAHSLLNQFHGGSAAAGHAGGPAGAASGPASSPPASAASSATTTSLYGSFGVITLGLIASFNNIHSIH